MVKLHLIFDNINTWKADKFLFTLNTDHKSLHLAESTWKKIPINNWYHQIEETLQKSSDYLCQVSNSQSTHPALKTNYPRSVPYYPVLRLTSAPSHPWFVMAKFCIPFHRGLPVLWQIFPLQSWFPCASASIHQMKQQTVSSLVASVVF